MPRLNFTKMVASGNDFVVVEGHHVSSASHGLSLKCLRALAVMMCDRKFGAGADGMLLMQRLGVSDARMRIFNADGSEAEMCGNGARCAALYIGRSEVRLKTLAGTIQARVSGSTVKVKLTDPRNMRLDMPVKVGKRSIWVNCVNTGVPHAVIFVDGLDNIDVHHLGRHIRYHKEFSPRGTNVNFIEVTADTGIDIRTYERGVEAETLACGTGSVASALVFALRAGIDDGVSVRTRSGEILRVFFKRSADKFRDVWLEGKARIVYKGVYNV